MSAFVDAPRRGVCVLLQGARRDELMPLHEANLYTVRSPRETEGTGLLLELGDYPIAHGYRMGRYGAEARPTCARPVP